MTIVEEVKEAKVVYVPDTSDINLNALLSEHSLLLGPLSDDAVFIRNQFLQRDNDLLSRGFMKQAKKDYQSLRESYAATLKQREEERRDAIGLAQPLLSKNEDFDSSNDIKKEKKIKKEALNNDKTIKSISVTSVDNIATVVAAEELIKPISALGSEISFDEGFVSPPLTAMDSLEDIGESFGASRPTTGLSELSSAVDETSDVGEHEIVSSGLTSFDIQRKQLNSSGGRLIGGSWGRGNEEDALRSTRLDGYPSLIIETWRPRPKGILFDRIDIQPDKSAKNKSKALNEYEMQMQEKKNEKLSKYTMDSNIAKILSRRFIDECSNSLRFFHQYLNSIGIYIPERMQFPEKIIEDMNHPYQLCHNRPNQKAIKPKSRQRPDSSTDEEDIMKILPLTEETLVAHMPSEWLIDSVYFCPAMGTLAKIEAWDWMPRSWWQPRRLHKLIEYEISHVDGLANIQKNETADLIRERKDLAIQLNELKDFLQGARDAVLSVGAKSLSEAKVLARLKAAKARLLSESKAKHTTLKNLHSEMVALIIKVQNLIDINEIDQALLHLGTESGFTSPGEAEMEKMKFHAVELVNKKIEESTIQQSEIESLSENIRKQEKDIAKFEVQCATLKGMLKNLALDRFDTVINVQKHMEEQLKQLNAYKTREIDETKRYKKLVDSLNKLHEMSVYYKRCMESDRFNRRFKDRSLRNRDDDIERDIDWEDVNDDSIEDYDYTSILKPRKQSMLDFDNLLAKSVTPEKTEQKKVIHKSTIDLNTYQPVKDVESHVPKPLGEKSEWPEWMDVDNSKVNPPPKLSPKISPKLSPKMNRQQSIDPRSGKPVLFHTGFSNIEDFRDFHSDSFDNEKFEKKDEKHLVQSLVERKYGIQAEVDEDEERGKRLFEAPLVPAVPIQFTVDAPEPPRPLMTRMSSDFSEVSDGEIQPDTTVLSNPLISPIDTDLLPKPSISEVAATPASARSKKTPSMMERRSSIAAFSKCLPDELKKLMKNTSEDDDVSVDSSMNESNMLRMFQEQLIKEEQERKNRQEENLDEDDDDYDLENRSQDKSVMPNASKNAKLNKKYKETQLSANELIVKDMEEEQRMKAEQRFLQDIPIEIVR
jgi:hypothetical protein